MSSVGELEGQDVPSQRENLAQLDVGGPQCLETFPQLYRKGQPGELSADEGVGRESGQSQAPELESMALSSWPAAHVGVEPAEGQAEHVSVDREEPSQKAPVPHLDEELEFLLGGGRPERPLSQVHPEGRSGERAWTWLRVGRPKPHSGQCRGQLLLIFSHPQSTEL